MFWYMVCREGILNTCIKYGTHAFMLALIINEYCCNVVLSFHLWSNKVKVEVLPENDKTVLKYMTPKSR